MSPAPSGKRARGRVARGRDRGAEGRRHDRRRPGGGPRSTRWRARRWRPLVPATCSPASWPRCSPAAWRRSAPRPAVYAHARAGRLAAGRVGAVESVVATDVIAALPAACEAGRRLEGAGDRRLGAVERNCARLARSAARRELCAVVKADGYGHGAVPMRGRRARRRGDLARGRHRGRGGRAAGRARRGRPAPRARSDGAGGARPALAAGADLAAWRPDFLELVAARGRELGIRPQVHVKYDTGMGRLGERDPAAVVGLAAGGGGEPRPRPRRRCGPTSRPPTRTTAASSSSSSTRFLVSPSRCASATRACCCTPPTAPRRCASRALTSTWSAAGSRSTASTRSARPVPSGTRARARASLVGRRRQALRAGRQRRLRAHLAAPGPTSVAVLPIGYGDGVRRGALQPRRRADQRPPPAARRDRLDGQHHGRPWARAGCGAGCRGGADRRPGGRADPRRGAGRALATINYEMTCGISPRVPRELRRERRRRPDRPGGRRPRPGAALADCPALDRRRRGARRAARPRGGRPRPRDRR